jgi:hypothetical protein
VGLRSRAIGSADWMPEAKNLSSESASAPPQVHSLAQLGRTAIQKILYFLQALNVPMRYRFDVHDHGPFARRLWRIPS